MRYELIKIVIILSIVTYIKYIRPCPTEYGYKLIEENKLSYKDLKKMNKFSSTS